MYTDLCIDISNAIYQYFHYIVISIYLAIPNSKFVHCLTFAKALNRPYINVLYANSL